MKGTINNDYYHNYLTLTCSAFRASKNGSRTYHFFTDTAEEMLR